MNSFIRTLYEMTTHVRSYIYMYFVFQVDNIPNGNYTLRLHLICRAEQMFANGVDICKAVTEVCTKLFSMAKS